MDYPVTLTLIIVDTKKENYVDVGFDWHPMLLHKNEVMLQQLVLDYIGASIGDKAVLPIDFSGYFGD